ncbi:hypothetical protein AB4099_12500 [Bosea sp. 2KB_26]|uniref:hypothetical protein n=1 Tax=Bosea sp. 2KB_26 TaxID=3237475 RepID=UPI003F93E5C9
MQTESDERRSQVVIFSFDKPEMGWKPLDAAKLFLEIQTFAIRLVEIQTQISVGSYVNVDYGNLLAESTDFRGDLENKISGISEFIRAVSPKSFDTELIAFRFNSPIDVALKFGTAISQKTLKTIMSAHDYLLHREATSRLKHAQAASAEQDTLAKKLQNLKTAIKLHQGIQNADLQKKFEESMLNALLPLTREDVPNLKMIELRDPAMNPPDT